MTVISTREVRVGKERVSGCNKSPPLRVRTLFQDMPHEPHEGRQGEWEDIVARSIASDWAVHLV